MIVTCPRCGVDVDQRFYGPCAACREQLREFRPPAPDERFEPAPKIDGSRAAWVG